MRVLCIPRDICSVQSPDRVQQGRPSPRHARFEHPPDCRSIVCRRRWRGIVSSARRPTPASSVLGSPPAKWRHTSSHPPWTTRRVLSVWPEFGCGSRWCRCRATAAVVAGSSRSSGRCPNNAYEQYKSPHFAPSFGITHNGIINPDYGC